jgi:hypothetical protein
METDDARARAPLTAVEIRVLGPGDDQLVITAAHLFDGAARADATRRFLGEAGNHFVIAYERGRAVGFVSGVEVTHPDKGTEMFIYELAVEEACAPGHREGTGLGAGRSGTRRRLLRHVGRHRRRQ